MRILFSANFTERNILLKERTQTQGQHCSKIIKTLQSLPLQMAERLRGAQTVSVANHVTACSISDLRALT